MCYTSGRPRNWMCYARAKCTRCGHTRCNACLWDNIGAVTPGYTQQNAGAFQSQPRSNAVFAPMTGVGAVGHSNAVPPVSSDAMDIQYPSQQNAPNASAANPKEEQESGVWLGDIEGNMLK